MAAVYKTFETKKTGTEVDVVVFNLINHAYDEQDMVRSTILYSLLDVSKHQPELVLTSIASYVSKRVDKIDMGHRVQLIEILVKISESAREHIKADVAEQIVKFAAQEMISVQEVKTDLQKAASQCLVNLSLCFPEAVIESLLTAWKPGMEPHYYIMKTLSDSASANPIACVLSLRDILSRIIPVLGLIKSSPMKWIFASTLGRLAEAINFYVDNATEEQKKVDLTSFEADMSSAWDVLFSKWLEGEPKVKFVVLESLGYISSVLGTRDFDSRFQKLAPTYLSHFKTELPKDHLPLTLGMSSLISKAVTDDRSFQNHALFTQIMSGLHDIISSSNHDSFSGANKEVLRCWEFLCKSLPDLTLNFIVNKFQLKSTSTRVGSLVIIRHLVNSLDNILQERRNVIMASVTTLLVQPELGLKSIILQLIGSMANQGYFVLEGAEQLVRFVCSQAAIKPGKAAKEGENGNAGNAAGNNAAGPAAGQSDPKTAELKRSAERLLDSLSNKVPTALPVLWPFLLELICDKEFTPAISTIFKAVGQICKAKSEAGDSSYILRLEQFVNIPPPQALVARIFILLSQPIKQPNLGVNVANAAIYLGQSIHAPLGQYWLETMPALIHHLETNQHEPTFSVQKWQDTILKVFREGLVTIGNESWLTDLVQYITQQLKHGDGGPKDPETTRLLFRFLGATLSRLQNKQLIQQHIDLMLSTVNHKNESERRGVAQALGMVGNPHLDMVLPRITELLTVTPEHRKAVGGFLGFGAKDLGPEDEVKATAVLTYGFITAYANPTTILSRLDVHVLHNIIPLLGLPTLDGKAVKEVQYPAPVLKIQLAKSLELIAKTVHPSRIPPSNSGFVLKKRDDLVQGILQMMDEKAPDGKPTAELRLLCLTTLSTMALLEPKFSKEMTNSLFSTIIPSYQLLLDNREIKSTSSVIDDYTPKEETKKKAPGDKNGQNAQNSAQNAQNNDSGDETDPLSTPGESLMNHVNTVWQALVQLNPTVDCILAIITKLQPLLKHKNAIVRQRAITSYLLILKKFVPKISQEKIPQTEKCFPELGKRTAFIMARVSDSIDSIRSMAVECIQAMLYIDQLLANPEETRPRADVKSLSELKAKIGVPSQIPLGALNYTDVDVVRSSRYVLLDQCAATFASASTAGDVVELIRAMITKLNDPDIQSGLGLSRILSKTVSIRGQNLFSELDACIEAYVEALKKPIKKEIKCAALQSLRLISKMHFSEVLQLLLKSAKTPLTREYCECFIALSDPVDLLLTSAGDWVEDQYALSFEGMETNKQLSSRLLDTLGEIINETPMDSKSPTPIVQSATCAFATIFQAANGVPSTAPLGQLKNPPKAKAAAPAAGAGAKPAPVKKPAPDAKVTAAGAGAGAAGSAAAALEEDLMLNYVFNYNPTQDAASQSALQSMLSSKYASIASTLLMRIGTAYKVHPKDPETGAEGDQVSMKQVIKALKQFFPSVSQNGVLASLNDVPERCFRPDAHKRDILNHQVIKDVKGEIWADEALSQNKHYDDSVAVITRMIVLDKPQIMKPMIKFLSHFLSQQSHVGQRVIATAIIAEFISHTGMAEVPAELKTPLQDELIRLLLPKVADREDKVRKHALRGLGNLVLVWGTPNIVANATAIITSCSGATEDTSAEVAAEAVSSLTRISSVADTTIISPMLVSICFRIRGAFDRKQARVRKAAFELFAEMCRFGVRQEILEKAPPGKYDVDLNNNFLEQVHTNLPIYLVHVWDTEESVRTAAMEGLKLVVTLLDENLEEFVCGSVGGQNGQISQNSTPKLYDIDDFNQFIQRISELICTHHQDRLRGYLDSCLGYYGSTWTQIRGSAAYLTGSFIRHSEIHPGTRKRLNLHSITSSMVKLLDQQDADVRNQTAKALAFLYDV